MHLLLKLGPDPDTIVTTSRHHDQLSESKCCSDGLSACSSVISDLPDGSSQVICWVLGEYGTVSGSRATEVMDHLCSIQETQNVSDAVKGYMLTAFGKLASHSNSRLTPAAEEAQYTASMSANPDLQQRAMELEAILRSPLGHMSTDPASTKCEALTGMSRVALDPVFCCSTESRQVVEALISRI